MRNLLFRALLVIIMIAVAGSLLATAITIGTGTATQNYPMHRYWNYSSWEGIYLASEMTMSGSISKIAFDKASGADVAAIQNVSIYMKQTSDATLATGDYSLTGYQLVYSGSFTNNAASGWMEVNLSPAFTYSNSSNLQVLILKGYQFYTSSRPYYRYTASTARFRQGYSDDFQPLTLTSSTNLANVRFEIAPLTGPAVYGQSVAELIFGSVLIGTTTPATTVIISNTGGTAMQISSVVKNGDDPDRFILTDPNVGFYPVTLNPGGSMNFSVAFNPTAVDDYSANISITDNLSKTTHPLPLSGSGFDPTITTFPYNEGFEGTTFEPLGWTNVSSTGLTFKWLRTAATTYGPACTPHEGTYMAEYNSFSSDAGNTAYLATPAIVVPDTNYRVSFWMYGDPSYETAPYDRLEVSLNSTPTTGGTVLETIDRYNAVAGWYQHIYPLGAAGTKYVVFNAISEYGSNIYLDDIKIEEIPTAVLPAILDSPLDGSSGNMLTTIMNWHADPSGPTPDNYKVYFGTDGGGITPPVNMVQDSPATNYIPSLSWNTTYYWQIVPSLLGVPPTATCPIWSFSTPVDPTIYPPYTQGFEGVTPPAFPDGWTATGTWMSLTSTEAHSGSICAKAAYTPAGTSLLSMPPIALPANYRISFWWKNDDIYAKVGTFDQTYFEIWNGGTSSWDILATLAPAAVETEYHQVIQSLATYSGTIYLRWRYVTDGTGSAWGVGLDDIVLEEMSAEIKPAINPVPADLATGVAITASLNWTKDSSGADPAGYNLYFGTDNPPSNIQGPKDVGLVETWTPDPGDLAYSGRYYWRIIPYDATNTEITATCPIWQFDTMADPTLTPPQTFDFEGVFPPTPGWINQVSGGTTLFATGTAYFHGGAAAAVFPLQLNTGQLITPPISLDSDNYEFGLWILRRDLTGGTTTPTFYIYTNTLPTTAGATLKETINVNYVDPPVVAAAGWYKYTYDFGVGSTGIQYIIIEVVGDGNWNTWFDDFTISAKPVDPVLAVDKTKLIIPVTPLGGASSDALTISNAGPGTLTGTIVYSTDLDGDYKVTPFSVTTTPVVFDVTYTPTALGLFTGTVQITSNGGNATVDVESNAGRDCVDWEVVPGGWDVYDLDANSYSWGWYSGVAHSGTYCVGDYYNSLGNDDWLISPWYTIQADDILSFYAKSQDPGYPESMEVFYSATGRTPTDFTSSLLSIPTIPGVYTGYSIPLAGLVGQTVSFGFHDNAVDSWYLWVDDIGLPDIAAVAAPLNVVATVDPAGTQLNWDAVTNATSYRIYWSSDPYAIPELWTVLAEVGTNSYLDIVTPLMKFYKIVAVNGSKSGNDAHELSAQRPVRMSERLKK